MTEISISQFSSNLDNIKRGVERACSVKGRNPHEISIMAVTKTHSASCIETALASGVTLFGENRVLEAETKYERLRGMCELHCIGHLQRNKAGRAVGLFSCIQSIDSIETCRALDRACEASGTSIDITIEVNTSREPSKNGVMGEADCFSLIERVSDYARLRMRGLMTVGPLTGDHDLIRASFRALKRLFDETRSRYPHLACDILSMGMSTDYMIAVEEGATLIRIGTALFGTRNN